MPFIDLPSHRLHYRIDGREGAPWLTFCNSLGTDLQMWEPQVQALSAHYRILRYDRRGHGQSGTPEGLYTIQDLAGDVLGLWDALAIERSHFCGLSIGGLTGQWLGLHATERLQRLAVCATAAKIGSSESWAERIALVQAQGLAPLADGTRLRWFTPAFVEAQPQRVDAVIAAFLETTAAGYAGCCNAVGTADFRGQLDAIAVPLLAIAGDDDPVCPPSDLQAIAGQAANGRFDQVHGRHICNLESPQAFSEILHAFLQG